MLGAIIGDLAGSAYEFEQYHNCHPLEIKGDLITKESFFTDDTILTIAILHAILDADGGVPDYERFLRRYGRQFQNYVPDTSAPHFNCPFSRNFQKWAASEASDGHGRSHGNGALMRISPVGYLFDNEPNVLLQAYAASLPSHNNRLAIYGAAVIAEVILFSRNGIPPEHIARKYLLELSYQPFDKYNYDGFETLWPCVAVALSATSFEDAIRTIISLGGDTDTNACIVGGIAEARFGVPDYLRSQALAKLPTEFCDLLQFGYSRVCPLK